ncbi:hypothetical protein Ddye_007855 [Dipteronia dyeriana]|uniref:RNase H type-1 domain-containing protein n=1 Tax=Dipteronia dyeriana TaxID=168575 RepID=A0AAD9XLB2_9ROSI|nr:hypothetical protein Ddye_007855 [Dipteronia dyeriana]
MKEIRWKRPREGLFKVNTDATICIERNIVGLGIVIRNHEGEVMGCSSQSTVSNYTPQIAEACAIFRGLLFAKDAGLLPAVIESDAKTVVDLINVEAPSRADIGIVISDIVYFCKLYDIRVVFASRSANVVAHTLAKVSHVAEDLFFLEDYPSSVENFVLADKLL